MNVLAEKTACLPRGAEPRRPARLLLSLSRMTSLTLALLLVIALVAISGIVGALKGAPAQEQYVAWSACAMLVLLAFVMLLLGRSATTRCLAIVTHHLRALSADKSVEVTPNRVPEDLKPVMAALVQYVDQVRARMDELRLQKKELDIQMRVAETERKNTEAIIFSISDAVLVIDSFGELILANTAAEALFDFEARRWRHRPIERILADKTLVALLKDARTTGEHSIPRQVEYCLARDGGSQTFNITLSTVVDAGGKSRGVVAVFHDVTREREVAQLKSDFVSAVSHELRTPLSSIKAYIEMLVDGEAHDEETRRQFYNIIDSETDRLQRLINNILNISRIESGMIDVHRQQVQVNDVTRGVLAMMKPQADDKDLQIECELQEYLPTIPADPDMLHQAILNILSNAVKYTPRGGRVRISTSLDDDRRQCASQGNPAKQTFWGQDRHVA